MVANVNAINTQNAAQFNNNTQQVTSPLQGKTANGYKLTEAQVTISPLSSSDPGDLEELAMFSRNTKSKDDKLKKNELKKRAKTETGEAEESDNQTNKASKKTKSQKQSSDSQETNQNQVGEKPYSASSDHLQELLDKISEHLEDNPNKTTIKFQVDDIIKRASVVPEGLSASEHTMVLAEELKSIISHNEQRSIYLDSVITAYDQLSTQGVEEGGNIQNLINIKLKGISSDSGKVVDLQDFGIIINQSQTLYILSALVESCNDMAETLLGSVSSIRDNQQIIAQKSDINK